MSDTDILFGDVSTVQIAGETVEVREMRWADGMRAMPMLAPIVEAVRRIISPQDGDDEAAMLSDMLTEHQDAWQALICASTGRGVEWLSGLSDQDGLTLQAAAWRANAAFFMRRPMLAAMMAPMIRLPVSSQNSSEADSVETTETSPNA